MYCGPADAEWDCTDEATVELRHLTRRRIKRIVYEYDFGDDWLHDIVIEKTAEAEKDAPDAACLGGKRACPPEDCGGPWGYLRLLEILADRKHPEYADWREWAGKIDPERFDREAVNGRLWKLFY
jgi:hypothetical protein